MNLRALIFTLAFLLVLDYVNCRAGGQRDEEKYRFQYLSNKGRKVKDDKSVRIKGHVVHDNQKKQNHENHNGHHAFEKDGKGEKGEKFNVNKYFVKSHVVSGHRKIRKVDDFEKNEVFQSKSFTSGHLGKKSNNHVKHRDVKSGQHQWGHRKENSHDSHHFKKARDENKRQKRDVKGHMTKNGSKVHH